MVVYPYNEILFSDNKEMSCQTTMEKHSCMLLSGRSQAEKVSYCMIATQLYGIFVKQNYRDNKYIIGCQELVMGNFKQVKYRRHLRTANSSM